MKKRRMSLVVLLLAVAGLPGVLEAADLLWEDFESYPVGTTPVPPWTEFYAGGGGSPVYTRAEAEALGVTIKIAGIGDPKSAHFLDTAQSLLPPTTTPVSSQITRSFSPSSQVVLEFDMMTHNHAYEGVFGGLVGDAPYGIGYTITFGGEAGGGLPDYIGVIGRYSWAKRDLLPFTTHTWYHVVRTLDATTNTGSFYVEEKYNSVNHARIDLGASDAGAYTTSNGVVFYTSWSQGADGYIDNIRVTPEPATLSLLALGGLAVLRRRRSECLYRRDH